MTAFLTAEELGAIAGIVLSLVFSYIPGVKNWFGGLSSEHKQMMMGLLLLGVAGAAFGLSCGNIIPVVECTQAGALGLVKVLIAALVANQSVYLITKRGGAQKQELLMLRAKLVVAFQRIDELQQHSS